VLINAHLANLGRPGTYAQEVKKGLRMANLPEVEVPNDVDSGAIFQVIPPKVIPDKRHLLPYSPVKLLQQFGQK